MNDYRDELMSMGAEQMAKDRARIKRLEDALNLIRDECDGHIDVEDRPDGEGVRPNLAMHIDSIALNALERK